MIIKTEFGVLYGLNVKRHSEIFLNSNYLKDKNKIINLNHSIAYPCLINSHDHLIGNWYPPAVGKSLYINAHDWVEDMRGSDSVLERNKIWVNKLPMRFEDPKAELLINLGVYKNLFSGVAIVQDHAPKQSESYYKKYPIKLIDNYRQCHSVILGDFWNGYDTIGICQSKMEDIQLNFSKGPFIIHLAEGIDETAKKEFQILMDYGLLKSNTLLIHGIALSEKELKKCADIGASICWCPGSNYNLIGKTLDIDTCLKYGVNVVLGTDSTLSGTENLFSELRLAHSKFPHIPPLELYKMITINASEALFLDHEETVLNEDTESVLIIKMKQDDPFKNLLLANSTDIELFIYKGLPLLGDLDLLENFDIQPEDYFLYSDATKQKFVYGHPELTLKKIESILGYSKKLPYLPFVC